MKKRVWLFSIFISGLICSSCAAVEEMAEPAAMVPDEQDTLEMEPDFSYVVPIQLPHIFVDKTGYERTDKKIAYFCGKNMQEIFEVCDERTGEVVYSGTLRQVKEMDGEMLYTGMFTDFDKTGTYYIHQEQVGDSDSFSIEEDTYNQRYKEIEAALLRQSFTQVSEQAYLLANYMFVDEMFAETAIDTSYIREKLQTLLYSQDTLTGAFYSEILKKPVDAETYDGAVSLTTTAQMAGVLAQYVYLYRDSEDPVFVNQCLQASQKAYRYMEKYRDNTDADAWYYAAVQLYRTMRQYKYRNAIIEYDTLSEQQRGSSEAGYTILADFTYLSTPYGTDYDRCAALMEGYLDKAQTVSTQSSREHFYVLENMDEMSDREILDDMIIFGVVNHILSGREYEGVQKNYIHYLSGANKNGKDYLNEEMLKEEGKDRINTVNATKLLVVYGNLYQCFEE